MIAGVAVNQQRRRRDPSRIAEIMDHPDKPGDDDQ
jgi:hypothetical protein